jgi:hypothetical protein
MQFFLGGDPRHPFGPAGKAIRACDAPLRRPFCNLAVQHTPK